MIQSQKKWEFWWPVPRFCAASLSLGTSHNPAFILSLSLALPWSGLKASQLQLWLCLIWPFERKQHPGVNSNIVGLNPTWADFEALGVLEPLTRNSFWNGVWVIERERERFLFSKWHGNILSCLSVPILTFDLFCPVPSFHVFSPGIVIWKFLRVIKCSFLLIWV